MWRLVAVSLCDALQRLSRCDTAGPKKLVMLPGGHFDAYGIDFASGPARDDSYSTLRLTSVFLVYAKRLGSAAVS
jgi:hypothetical protein